MDSNTTITLGLLFMIFGGIASISGILSKRDAQKINEGREHGIMLTKLENIENGQINILAKIAHVETKVADVQDKVNEIDRRVTVLENKRKRTPTT